jgi:head-tail adaptor
MPADPRVQAQIDSGRYRTRLFIEQDVGTAVNASNEHIPSWKEIGSRRAAVAELTGKEIFFAAAVQNNATLGIEHRYFPGLTTAMRYRYEDPVLGKRYFYVVYVLDVAERHKKHVTGCLEVEDPPEQPTVT